MRCLLACLSLFGVATAQWPAGPAADPLVIADPTAVHLERLNVKLREGCGAELREGKLHSRVGVDLAPVARWFALANAEPLVRSLSWDELAAMQRQASAALPQGRGPGHLGLWFRLTTPTAHAALELQAALAAEPLVEIVYHEARWLPASAGAVAMPQDIPPPTPPFMALQQPHGPTALGGHGVRAAAAVLGGRGQTIGVRMIEDSWFLDHEDVGQLVAGAFVGPIPPFDLGRALHGLSGTAILCADRNGYGITGVADEVTARFFGVSNGSLESNIALAIAQSQPGDVILIVLMILVPSLGPGTFLPVEFLLGAFQAIQTATALGRHVLLAGGNGSRSLDDPALLNRFDRSFRDSGAIIVASSFGGAPQRASYSNWGSRIDAHSWGDFVVSCGYGDLFFPGADMRQSYTQAGTGTSSSTPHIAGLVAQIQGASRRQSGQTLSNAQMVSLLHSFGLTTPDVIGRRPDVDAIFGALNLFDGLRLSVPDALVLPNGASVDVQMSGPTTALFALFASLTEANVPIGWNRNLHLDPLGATSLGVFALPGGTATFQLAVPANPTLQGVDVFFQAVRLDGQSPLSLTNSCHFTVL